MTEPTPVPATLGPDREQLTRFLADVRERQQRVWPQEVPREIVYPLGERTLPEYVSQWARQRPDVPAIVFEGRTVTYRALDDAVARVAGWLLEAGVQPGDRVGVHLPNCPEFTIAMMAILRVGAVHIPVNPLFQKAELEYELTDAGVEVLFSYGPLAAAMGPAAAASGVREVVLLGDVAASEPALHGVPWEQVLQHDPYDGCATDLDALAALNYTSGTSGMPKGCMHTQRDMLYTAASAVGGTRSATDGTHTVLCFIPIFWIAGEDLGILCPIVCGGTVVLMPRWDATRAADLIEQHRVAQMTGTVECYLEMLALPDLAERDLSSLRDPMAMSFIRKLTPAVRAGWKAAVGEHSVLREAAYGMTETHTFDVTPYGMSEGDRDLLTEPVFCGLPVPETEIAVIETATGRVLPIGERGELILRSPSVTSGYWNRPDATAEQIVDGWLHTGDNAFIDEDGCLHYLGRDKEMIKVNGMSVFPAEVEVLLAQHEDVLAVAVVAAPHARTGEVPVAFVRLQPGATVTAEQLTAWARGAMAAYKVPLVQVVEDYPMTATGKIRKVELVSQATELAAGGSV